MIRQTSRRHGASGDRGAGHQLADDWPVYVALLPAIIASGAIAITAAIALGTASAWHPGTPQVGDLKATPAAEEPENEVEVAEQETDEEEPEVEAAEAADES